MTMSIRSWSLRALAAGLTLSALPLLADDEEAVVRLQARPAEGVVRVSDQTNENQEVVRGQSPGATQTTTFCQTYPGGSYCPPPGYQEPCRDYCCNSKFCMWLHANADVYHARTQMQTAIFREVCRADCEQKGAVLRGKFGYFCPTGCCGAGCPPIGCYSMVYPVDPSYFDSRDGQVYGTSETGGPVAVPLAPVVNHTYNYGWGVPSSRLTPVLQPITQTPVSMIPGPIPEAPIAR